MSTQVTNAFVQQYKSNVIMLSQEKGSKFRGIVREDPDFLKGKAGYFERIGSTSAVLRTTRHGDTPLQNTPHSRRRITMNDYEWADLIDNQDRIRMLIDPESSYAMNAAWAMGRQADVLIRDAALGSAYSMDEDDTASAVALPTAQKVGVDNHDYDSGSGDVGLTVGKLIAAKEIFEAGNVDSGEQLYCAINAKQKANLLTVTEIQSADYNSVRALVQGEVNSFMGFTFIDYQNLSTDDSSDQQVFCWANSGLGLAVGSDVEVRVSERADKSYSTQVYLAMSMGATRVEDEKVVEIACDPS